jgi:hypothetical protein
MKKTFTFEFNDDDNQEYRYFLNIINSKYSDFLDDFESFLKMIENTDCYTNEEFQSVPLTQDQFEIYWFIRKKYFEFKNDNGVLND